MGKKEKKEKKVIVPFNKIDITTATEDDIIKSGIRDNVKSDFICYGIMALIVVLMLLPPFLRLTIPKPITEIDKDIVYVTLSCSYPTTIEDYNLYTDVVNNYRDGVLTKVEIKYSYQKVSELGVKTDENEEVNEETDEPEEKPTFAAIEKMKEVDAPGFTKKEVDRGYIFTADFENYNFSNVEELKNYSYVAGAESDYLKSIGYYCSTESETVRERVYVDTGKKVE